MMKAKFGEHVRSKSEMGQANEVLAKVLCHNVCVLIRATHDLGIEAAFGSETPLEPKPFLWRGFRCKAGAIFGTFAYMCRIHVVDPFFSAIVTEVSVGWGTATALAGRPRVL